MQCCGRVYMPVMKIYLKGWCEEMFEQVPAHGTTKYPKWTISEEDDKYEHVLDKCDNACAYLAWHRVGIVYDLGGAKQNVMAQFLDYKDNCKRKFLFVFILQGWSWEVLTNVVNDVFMIFISKLDEDTGYWYSWCWYVEDVVEIGRASCRERVFVGV